MDQVEIDVVQAQARQRFLDSVVGTFTSVLVMPDLGCDKNRGAW